MGWLRPSLLIFILFLFAIDNVKSDTVTSTDETRIDTSTKAETTSSTTEKDGPRGNDNDFAGRLKERTERMKKKRSTESKIQSGPVDDEYLTEEERKEEAAHRVVDAVQIFSPDSPKTDRSMPAAERGRVLAEWLKKKKDVADEHFKSRPDTSNSYNSYNSYPSYNSKYGADSDSDSSDSEGSYGRSSSRFGTFMVGLIILIIIGGIFVCYVMENGGNGRRGGNMPMYNARNQYANTPLDGSLVQKNYAVRGSVATATPKSVTPVTKTTSKEVTNSKIGETSVEVV